jgi:hypothetical protein
MKLVTKRELIAALLPHVRELRQTAEPEAALEAAKVELGLKRRLSSLDRPRRRVQRDTAGASAHRG